MSRLKKVFGATNAIDDVSFEVADGEFVTLLGPSGCGKSTTLAAIAGLSAPTSGRIAAGPTVFFDAATRTNLESEYRNCGLVFQSYALWPHMTVARNVSFPLEMRRTGAQEMKERVRDVLRLVELEDMSDRFPHQLSGGQQQRVALARTLVYRPSILLLDEPLSNLDAKLREKARTWLRQVHERVKITTIYVTHDQSEALALSDRIVVMKGGRITQIGTPREIYNTPASPAVAEFIGTSTFLNGTAARLLPDSLIEVALTGGAAILVRAPGSMAVGSALTVALRPERIALMKPNEAAPDGVGRLIGGRIVSRTYLGNYVQYDVDIGGILVKVESTREVYDRDDVGLWIPDRACSVFTDARAA